ncbi:MAG: metallophosphoesterase [Armatimonadetes bacterium]|nr:metallophosphoesterase [Armatimonadota bacterium]
MHTRWRLAAVLMLALPAWAEPQLLLDLDAGRLPAGPLPTWAGATSSELGGAVVATVAGRRAVTFDGRADYLVSDFAAPATMAGAHAFTVAAWAFNPEIGPEECLLCWAHRGVASRCGQLNYGTSKSYGAACHWGEADMGFGTVPAKGQWHLVAVTYTGGPDGTETVWIDGRADTQARKSLNLFTSDRIYLATADYGRWFSGSLAAVLLYDRALGAADMGALAAGEVVPGALVDLSAAALSEGRLAVWPNRGAAGGAFARESTAPRVDRIAERQAVVFAGKQSLTTPLTWPTSFTVQADVYLAEPVSGAEPLLALGDRPDAPELAHSDGRTPSRLLPLVRVAPKRWQQLAWVVGPGRVRVYLDGDLQADRKADLRPGTGLRLGAGADRQRGFHGAVSRLRVWAGVRDQLALRNDAGRFEAFGPQPAVAAAVDSLHPTLAWLAGSPDVGGYDVYLDADLATVSAADRGGPAWLGRRGAGETQWGPVDLRLGGAYAWRVDQLGADGRVAQRGPVWTFRAPTGAASGPQPRHRVAGVSAMLPALHWTPGPFATAQKLYLGDDRGAVEAGTVAPLDLAAGAGEARPPGALAPGRAYYWRVEQINGDLPPVRGDMWTFRTADPLVKDDVTFYVCSDSHYGVTDTVAAANRGTIDFMNQLPGVLLPPALGEGVVLTPRGVVVTGDLTDSGTAEQWAEFGADFGLNGEGRLVYPVFEGRGNHDGGMNAAVCPGIIARNKQRAGLTAMSANGLHYSWDWDRVHLVQTSLYPGDQRDRQGHMDSEAHEPHGSLTFLREDLARHVGTSGRPVIIFLHLGWDDFSTSWGWWSEAEREAFYQAIRDYNVIALVHGHTHAAVNYKWRGLDVYNVGSSQRDPGVGECYVFRVTPRELLVAHRFADRWGITARKPIQ